MRFSNLSRLAFWSVAVLATSAIVATSVDARVGSGRSAGSRGSNTFSAPPATNTAPKPAAPIERSMTQPGKSAAAAPVAGAAQAGKAAAGAAAQTSRFGGLMKGLLLGGLMSAAFAGIFGMGALANVLGFVLQTALIAGVIFLIFNFFRNRSAQPAMATASPGAATANREAQNASYRMGVPGNGATPALKIGPDDFNTFERLLGEVQNAYGRQDTKTLGDLVTPEMLSYFAQDLADNAKKGVRNEVRMGKLLQGDLAEAWTEAGGDYATVAMRYSIQDATVETATGKVLDGSTSDLQEVTEVWTFRRPVRGSADQWELSAIQQA